MNGLHKPDTIKSVSNAPVEYGKSGINKAYVTVSEFLSALSWENNSLVTVHPAGGAGIPEEFRLRKAKSVIKDFPRIPLRGYTSHGYNLFRIPGIDTADQKNGVIMFREAVSSNNHYLSFLFFWQILEIGNGNAIGWVDKAYRKKRNRLCLSNSWLRELSLGAKTLGKYFSDDCRNAIAHIARRRVGKVQLKLDSFEEMIRIAQDTAAIKEFARLYIIDKLRLRKHMYLVGKYGERFPVFVAEKEIKKFPWPIAYKA